MVCWEKLPQQILQEIPGLAKFEGYCLVHLLLETICVLRDDQVQSNVSGSTNWLNGCQKNTPAIQFSTWSVGRTRDVKPLLDGISECIALIVYSLRLSELKTGIGSFSLDPENTVGFIFRVGAYLTLLIMNSMGEWLWSLLRFLYPDCIVSLHSYPYSSNCTVDYSEP